MYPTDPYRLWTLTLQTSWMLAEAQTVVALRLWGMAGLWPVSPTESSRMLTEKWPAFVQSDGAAGAAMMKGHGPERVAEAALRPIRKTTRANSRRLRRRRRLRS